MIAGNNGPAVYGAILTGGRSTRMGRDKAFVPIEGVYMVVRVATALGDGGVDPIIAIGGDRLRIAANGIASVADDWPGEGPLGGIITAMTFCSTPWVFVVACDLAMLSAPTIRRLCAAAAHSSDDGDLVDVVVAQTDRLQPLCAVWRRTEEVIATLAEAFEAGERSVQGGLARLRVMGLAVEASELSNFNAPQDLR